MTLFTCHTHPALRLRDGIKFVGGRFEATGDQAKVIREIADLRPEYGIEEQKAKRKSKAKPKQPAEQEAEEGVDEGFLELIGEGDEDESQDDE